MAQWEFNSNSLHLDSEFDSAYSQIRLNDFYKSFKLQYDHAEGFWFSCTK